MLNKNPRKNSKLFLTIDVGVGKIDGGGLSKLFLLREQWLLILGNQPDVFFQILDIFSTPIEFY